MKQENDPVTEKGELSARMDKVVEKAKEVCKRLEDQATTAAKATDETIRGHPYESIGIAFGVGLLVGVLLSRRGNGGGPCC